MCRRSSLRSTLVAATLLGFAPSLPASKAVGESAGGIPGGSVVADAQPMYVGDPLAGGSFAAIPVGLGDGLAPSWPRWFAGASGLVMTRTLPAGSATMQPLPGVQLETSDTGVNWPGGVDVHLGRWFGLRQQNAIELIYWGIYQLGGVSSVRSTSGSIQAIPQAPGVSVAGQPATSLLNNLDGQTISRTDIINDVEVNWVYSLWERPEFLPRERPVNLMWLVGFRFFEVSDELSLQNFGDAPPPEALNFDVATNNNLFGAQVGAKFDWRVHPRLRLNLVPKFMIAGNAITNTSAFVQENGSLATFTVDGDAARVHSTLGVFSWLGSVDTGLAWDVTDHWSLCLGYRVVGVGNIAQADDQWPITVSSSAALSGIAAGTSTIVHGGFAGFEGRY